MVWDSGFKGLVADGNASKCCVLNMMFTDDVELRVHEFSD